MVRQLAAVTDRYADVNGVRLHYVEAGSGPLVVLLHGFPDFWYSWRHQIPALAAAGYRVVAPDMRGYNLSDKPSAVADYDVDRLAADVAGLIAACGEEKAVVAGHDWGAGVAWWFAMHYPQMLTKLAILNVPHPERMLRGLRDPRQLLRSWYIFFFQIPGLPEALMRADRYRVLREMMRKDPLRPGAFTPADIDRYVEAAARSNGLHGPIHYYRALFRRGAASVPLRRIEAPVLVIWGERDRYLRPELAAPDPKWVPNCRVERIADASHWVHMDQPDRVNGLLLDFLRG